MRKILIFCAVLSSVLFAEIDERKSDIYYGNGIMTTKAEALDSLLKVVKPSVLNDIYYGDQVKMDKLHTFDLAYNYSAKEKFENTMIATVLDLMESYEQMGNTSFGWGAVTSVLNLIGGRIAIVSKWTTKRVSNFLVKEGVPTLAASFLAKEIIGASKTRLLEMAVNFFQYDPTEIHDSNLKEMVEKYTTSIKDGHGIILVTHSQGNLFAIEATNRVNFSMGIQAFKPWMRNYVHHVSIASPATKFSSDSHWLTSLDNDVVANNPGAVGPKLRNPIRYFTHKADSISPAMNIDATREWTDNPPLDDSSPDGYWLDKVTPPSFTKTVQADSGFGTVGVIQDFTIHVVPDEWKYSATEFHAFDNYMGLTKYQVNVGSGQTREITSINTRKKIIEDIESAIQKHKNSPSQWEKFESIGCGCDGRITLKHIELYGGIYSLMQGIKVLEFKPDGKVYQVDGNYIKASPEGTTIDDQTSLDNGICYVLDGTGEQIDGSTGLGVQPHSGILESTLSWKSPDIELKLRVSGPTTGIYDLENSECPTRHWYIATENEVKEGTYFISINNIGTTAIDENLFPQKVSLDVGTPDGGVEFSLDIENVEDLSMGAVAKVTVTKKGTISVVIETTEVVKSNPTVKADVYVTTAEGTRYDYKTESLLNQVKFGPIAGAIFEVSQFVDSKGVIYSGATSSGNSIEDNGLMLFPSSLKDVLEDDNLYLITARGGRDVDANDDFVMDDVATTNLGEIHAIVSGADIKEGSLKVNIMTEIAYQVLSKSGENNITKIKMSLDKISQKLFRRDINSDKEINRADLHSWLPGFDKSKLLMSYDEKIEPIVQKVYANEDIYLDVDKLIVPLVADAGEDMFIGVSPTLKLDGSKSYDINGNIVEYFWMEDGRLLCSSDKPICEIDMLSVGKHFITLRVSDNDGNTQDDTLNITINSNAPTANAGVDQEIFQDSTITLDGSNSYDSNGKIVDYLWTSQDFVICQGSNPVCVIENLRVSDYEFFLTVSDDEGFSGKDSVNIIYPYKPVAEAGNDVSISFGTSVTLDGSKSYDNDGYIVEYQWSEGNVSYCRGTMPTCTIDELTFGTHKFELQVKDEKGIVGSDNVEVIVKSEARTIGSFDIPSGSQIVDIALSKNENFSFMADNWGRLHTMDISDPASPSLLGSYITSSGVVGVALSLDNNIAYIANNKNGLQILDISNPAIPYLLGSYTTLSYANDVLLSEDGTIAYVSTGYKSGLQIIDISIPESPTLIGNYMSPEPATLRSVTLSADGTIAYLAMDYDGIQIIDISNPSTPYLIGRYETPGWAYHIALSSDGKIAYIADGGDDSYAPNTHGGLQILDVSNPASPQLIGSYDTPDWAFSVSISTDGNVAYIADDKSGLQFIDISNPASPSLIGSFDTPVRAYNLTLSTDGKVAYVSDGGGDLQIIDISAFAP